MYLEEATKRHHGRTLLYWMLCRRGHCQSYPTVDVVRELLVAYPPALWERPFQGGSPLEAACWSRAPLSILTFLTGARPCMPHDMAALRSLWDSYTAIFDANGISLIDYVCEGGREGAEIWIKLHLLLRYCTDPSLSMSSWRGMHAAASSPSCSKQLFTMTLRMNPGESRRRDEFGRLPLHHLAFVQHQESWREKLDLLLEAYPDAVWIRDNDGLLPLHTAVIVRRSLEFIDVLIRASPDALAQKGGSDSLYPFQLAAVSSQVSLTFHLLRAAPHLVLDDPGDCLAPIEEGDSENSTDTISTNTGVSPVLAPGSSNGYLELLNFVGSCAEPKMWNELLELLRIDVGRPTVPWRALHAAASLATLPLPFLDLAVRLYPEELQQMDEAGRLPLHIVSSLEDVQIHSRVKTILGGFPLAVTARDNDGRLALHGAITSGKPWSVLAALISAAPETLFWRDRLSKLYPFQLAACSPSCRLNELYLLLVAAPHLLTHHMR